MFGGDDIGAVVLDVGSDTLKAGHAGEDTPRAVFSSQCARLLSSSDNENPSLSQRSLYVGRDAQVRRDAAEITQAVQHGEISDWEAVEGLLRHAFTSHLSLDLTLHPLLWCEPTGSSKAQREKMTSLLFEQFNVPAVFFCRSPVLVAFATGRSTALVCESGAGVTTVAPVHEGYVLSRAVKRTCVAGDVLDHLTQSLICKQAYVQPSSLDAVIPTQPVPLYALNRRYIAGSLHAQPAVPPQTLPSYHCAQQRELLKDIKETVCRLSETPFDINGAKFPSVPYELPDGKTLDVSNERFAVAEHLFVPSPIKDEYPFTEFEGVPAFKGIPALIRSSLESVDIDLHKDLYSSLVCAGGTTLMTGFASRLSRDLATDMPAAHKVKVVLGSSNSDRKYAAWMGGSILASLGSFHQMWVSKQEYQDQGSKAVASKCP